MRPRLILRRATHRAADARRCTRARTAALSETQLKRWWVSADEDCDGSLNTREAVAFLSRSGLSRAALARIWCASHRGQPLPRFSPSLTTPSNHPLRDASRAQGGTRGALSFAEFAAAIRLCGMAQQSVNLLDSGITVRRAVQGQLALAPGMEGVDDGAAQRRAREQAARAAAAQAAVWATPLAPESIGAVTAPPSITPPPPPPPPPRAPAFSEPDAELEQSPLRKILAAAAAAERERQAAERSQESEEEEETPPAPRSLRLNIKPADDASATPQPQAQPLAPPPASARGGFAAALLARGHPSTHAPPPAPPPSVQTAWVHEEQRSRWAGSQLQAAGVRGRVFALPQAEDASAEMRLSLHGAPISTASVCAAPSAQVACAPASDAAMKPLRDAHAPLQTLWQRAAAARKDPAFIRATNPETVHVRLKAPLPNHPTAVCAYVLGARGAPPPLLQGCLRRRRLVVPFKSAAELCVALRARCELRDVHVALCLGDAVGGGALELLKCSHPGCWDPARAVFIWRVTRLGAEEVILLRLHASADPRRAHESEQAGYGPAHATLTAEADGALASGLTVSLPPRCVARTSTRARVALYLSAEDAARHSVEGPPAAESPAAADDEPHPAQQEDDVDSSDDEDTSPRSSMSASTASAPPSSRGPQATAAAPLPATVLFDFVALADGELSIRVDDVVTVSSAAAGGWLEAQNVTTGQTGLVPETYVVVERS